MVADMVTLTQGASMQYYELVSQGLHVVSNTVAPRRMSCEHARGLNIQLHHAGSLRWITKEHADEFGYAREGGVDSDGFNADGFDGAGYDADGFDVDNLDINHCDSEGLLCI